MGQPKAWLPFAGELMLPRVVRLLGQAVQPIVVVAAPGQDVPPLSDDITIVRDEEKGRGPLEGLAAGLTALAGTVDAAYLSSCNVPFLVPAFVRRMVDLLESHAICVPHVAGFHHPLAAVYRLEVLDAVHRLLAENRLRPVFLFEQCLLHDSASLRIELSIKLIAEPRDRLRMDDALDTLHSDAPLHPTPTVCGL